MPANTAEGGEVSAQQAQRALSCPFHAGRMPNKSITLKLETSRERFRKEWFFSIRNYLSTRPWAKPAVAPSCQWEICTSALKAAQTSCTYSVTAARSHCLLERLLCVPSPTCHDRNKPVRSSLWTTFFFIFKWCDLLLENPDSIPLHQLLFYENSNQGIHPRAGLYDTGNKRETFLKLSSPTSWGSGSFFRRF